MKSIWKFFQSIKLAIFLIIIITAASILGTLIPQQRPLAEYVSHYGQLAQLFSKLQFTNLYHSWWYIALLFLLTVNITICSLSRLSPKLRKAFHPHLAFESKTLLALKVNNRFHKKTGVTSTVEGLKKELVSRHYRIKEQDKENKKYLYARKKILGWFGSDILHLGLLIILLGGIISGLIGFRTTLNLMEGQSLQVPNADFMLKLDKFQTDYYPDGAVKDWKSTLFILDNGQTLASKTIEVNHPLSHKGFIFYQSSYGWNWENPTLEILAKSRKDPSFSKKLDVKINEKVSLNHDGTEISILNFIPDFIIGENNEITTRSLEPNNPAAFIEGWKGEEKIFSGWIFARYPDFAKIHASKETDFTLVLSDYKAAQYSGIQVAKDPGASIVWVGCGLLMFGLMLAFYWPAREVKIILEESEGKTEITAGGIASKGKDAFQSEFEKIMASIRSSK